MEGRGRKKEGKGVKNGRMKSRRGERGLTIILGSTDKDGGQMLSPVLSGWAALVSTPNIGKLTQLRATLVRTHVCVYVCVVTVSLHWVDGFLKKGLKVEKSL